MKNRFKTPQVGQKLYYPKYGLLTVAERGILKRGNSGRIGLTGDSLYSIMKNEDGETITHEGKPARFYDDFLTPAHFDIKNK